MASTTTTTTLEEKNNNLLNYINSIYDKLLDIDSKVRHHNTSFKTFIIELAYYYDQAIKSGALDLETGLIFDQIISKLKNKGATENTINYCYKIFDDPDLLKYRIRPPKQTDNSNPTQIPALQQETEKNKKILDDAIKCNVSAMMQGLDNIKKLKTVFKEQYAQFYDPKLHNPPGENNDYNLIRDDLELLETDVDSINEDLGKVDLDNLSNKPNSEIKKKLKEEYEKRKNHKLLFSDVWGFKQKYPNLDQKNLIDPVESMIDPITNSIIRVRDESEKPIETAFTKAWKANIKAREEFLQKALHNPLPDEIAQRWAIEVENNTLMIKTSCNDKCSHDYIRWIEIILEKFSQSTNSASSKSRIKGLVTNKLRGTTREQIIAKAEEVLRWAVSEIQGKKSFENLTHYYAYLILKRRNADFHIERHTKLSNSA